MKRKRGRPRRGKKNRLLSYVEFSDQDDKDEQQQVSLKKKKNKLEDEIVFSNDENENKNAFVGQKKNNIESDNESESDGFINDQSSNEEEFKEQDDKEEEEEEEEYEDEDEIEYHEEEEKEEKEAPKKKGRQKKYIESDIVDSDKPNPLDIEPEELGVSEEDENKNISEDEITDERYRAIEKNAKQIAGRKTKGEFNSDIDVLRKEINAHDRDLQDLYQELEKKSNEICKVTKLKLIDFELLESFVLCPRRSSVNTIQKAIDHVRKIKQKLSTAPLVFILEQFYLAIGSYYECYQELKLNLCHVDTRNFVLEKLAEVIKKTWKMDEDQWILIHLYVMKNQIPRSIKKEFDNLLSFKSIQLESLSQSEYFISALVQYKKLKSKIKYLENTISGKRTWLNSKIGDLNRYANAKSNI